MHTLIHTPLEIQIRPFQTGDADAFRELNEEWIVRHFGMEELDHLALGDPEGHILKPGGHILMAVQGERIVGCCALIPKEPGVYELAKMAVAAECRGKGIGRKILQSAIAQARALGATLLYLGSNRKLPNAVHLYESVGFRHLPPERIPSSPYARADVFMELVISLD